MRGERTMTPGQWGRVKAVLDDALERPPDAREAYIAAACGTDAELRRQVAALARAAEAEGGILDAPNAVAGTAEVSQAPGRAGQRIGAYELLAEIGHGGMGVVYLARRADDEFQKRVAVKLMRPGLVSELDLRRFRGERQIAAALDHPGIARLLDGGTTGDGEPYFVMEHVEGQPLLEFCDDHGLSLPERLALFRDVCAAVQYAHQNLVVHRDLKPGNILVTPDGAPKLLDFGIAKLLTGASTADTGEATATLERVLTPDYASPEQVRGRPLTTASDVYSLGVVLYELVAGEKPYRIASSDPTELVRLVCERDPERPSARAAGLSRDLDAIVLKAMRKEPEGRYASATALSDDLGRYLDGRPVEARRGSAAYRARKFVRRHRVGAAAALLVFAALAGGAWATLREARHARIAEARAERRFDDVRRLANSFLFEFHDAIRDLPGSTAARALVVRRALEYLDSLSTESGGDRALRRELAEAYRRVGDVQGNPFTANLGDAGGAVASYEKAVRLLGGAVALPDATDDERSSLATTYLMLGGLYLNQGKREEALAISRKGLALRQTLAACAPADHGRQMDLSQAWQFVAFDASAAGKAGQAAGALASQSAILEVERAAHPSDPGVRRSLGQNRFLVALAAKNAGDFAVALGAYREAEQIQEALAAEDASSVTLRRDLAYTHTEIGETELGLGEAAAALEEYRRALSVFEAMAAADAKNTDPILGLAMSHHNMGETLSRLGRRSEALAEFRLARPRYEAVAAASPTSAWVSGMLATLYVRTADLEAASDAASACGLYARALALFEAMSTGGGVPADRRALRDRARAAAATCRGAS
ncbi:MAG TPA: protein kinase [Thermoanaerobaculia bacterium]|nr:protein kinase [Thermoanaerobaculia bacterium]